MRTLIIFLKPSAIPLSPHCTLRSEAHIHMQEWRAFAGGKGRELRPLLLSRREDGTRQHTSRSPLDVGRRRVVGGATHLHRFRHPESWRCVCGCWAWMWRQEWERRCWEWLCVVWCCASSNLEVRRQARASVIHRTPQQALRLLQNQDDTSRQAIRVICYRRTSSQGEASRPYPFAVTSRDHPHRAMHQGEGEWRWDQGTGYCVVLSLRWWWW
jgi:hypothetical protein